MYYVLSQVEKLATRGPPILYCMTSTPLLLQLMHGIYLFMTTFTFNSFEILPCDQYYNPLLTCRKILNDLV
jgi:hypothetical protein